MLHQETIATYNQHAAELAEYFAGIGPRVDLIEEGLKLAGSPKAGHVVEVGCGDGRDAQDITTRVGWYEGFDPSIELIKLARKRLPNARFVIADALSYEYPNELDAVFGFASFLHLNKEDFSVACATIAEALKPGGILLMTLKERDAYQEELVEDEFGKRIFYYYDDATVNANIPSSLNVVEIRHQTLNRKTAKWLVVVLQKRLSASASSRATQPSS